MVVIYACMLNLYPYLQPVFYNANLGDPVTHLSSFINRIALLPATTPQTRKVADTTKEIPTK
ncbi:hypothetical protein B0F90DRAFT_1706676 [Multifurca ochricompacta]|uniref:Uncharacterized protein n=1 Tax=Multifurca ochricompacta TaxID=376703 RepID=A0AAD4QNZ5_9AGAM|nr:hypothetical protein B0F90DRAFT_1706676 [Multifurca ochricompacta]